MKTVFAWLLTSLMLLTTHALAANYTKAQIEQLAAEHAESIYPSQADETLKAFPASIDSRLKINPCTKALSASAPNFSPYSNNLTIKIKCDDENAWTLFVPVQVKILTPVVIATSYIEAGHTISKSDVEITMLEKNRSRNGFIADITTVIGSKAKRQIKSGQAIINRNICFVCQGELVTIEAIASGLSVKAAGIALSDGSYGETVSVKNRRSNRIVQGRVSSVGEVQIFL